MASTADLLDERPDALVCRLALGQYGGVTAFEGPIATVRCHEDNVLVKQRVAEPGRGRILVVDGCVRDVAVLRHLPIGLKALGSCPRPSGKAGLGEVDVPVEFGGVTFCPGARLVSDDDGVVVLDAAD